MPIYEYACEKCGHEFEVEQRITEDPVKTCPQCRARKVKKLISRTSFVLKGSGWYSDLYSSPSAKDKGADKDKDKGESKDASDGASTDTKPEKKKSGGDDKGEKSGGKKGKGKGKAAA